MAGLTSTNKDMDPFFVFPRYLGIENDNKNRSVHLAGAGVIVRS